MQPTDDQRETLDRHRDIYRQAYNHFLYRLDQFEETPSMTTLRAELPGLKEWWTDLTDVYSRAFKLDKNGGRTVLHLSKTGDIPLFDFYATA